MTTPDRRKTADSVLATFNDQAEDRAKEARALAADAKQRLRIIAQDEQQDAQDRAALADLERRVHALTTQVTNRVEQLNAKRGELREVERQRDEKTAEADAIIEIVGRERDRLAAEKAQQNGTLPPGVVPASGSPLDTRHDGLPTVEQGGGQAS